MIIMIMIMNLSNEYLTMGTNHKVHHHVCITEHSPIFKSEWQKKSEEQDKLVSFQIIIKY